MDLSNRRPPSLPFSHPSPRKSSFQTAFLKKNPSGIETTRDAGHMMTGRSVIAELESRTFQSLNSLYEQEKSHSLPELRRLMLQVDVLDKSLQQLSDVIRIQCADQAKLLLRLWNGASELYSEIFKGLTRTLEETQLLLNEKILESNSWEAKYRECRKECSSLKSVKATTLSNDSEIQILEMELVRKDKELLKFEDLSTSISIWFPNFSKYCSSSLGHYLPPAVEDANRESNLAQDIQEDYHGYHSEQLAEHFLFSDLKRLEKLDVGLEIFHSQLDPRKQVVESSFPANHGTSSPNPDLSGQKRIEHELDPKEFFRLQGGRLSVAATVTKRQEAATISNDQGKSRQLIIKIQELENLLTKKSESLRLITLNTEKELLLAKQTQSHLTSQISQTRSEAQELIKRLPRQAFLQLTIKTVLEIDISDNCEIFPLKEVDFYCDKFLREFSLPMSIFASDSNSSFTYDNLTNPFSGQGLHLQSILPAIVHWKGIQYSSVMLSVMFQYFFRAFNDISLTMKIVQSLCRTAIAFTEDSSTVTLGQFFEIFFGLSRTEFSNKIDQLNGISLVVHFYKQFKCSRRESLDRANIIQRIQNLFRHTGCSPRTDNVLSKMSELPFWALLPERSQQRAISSVSHSLLVIDPGDNEALSLTTAFRHSFLSLWAEVQLLKGAVIEAFEGMFEFLLGIFPDGPGSNREFSLLFTLCISVNPLENDIPSEWDENLALTSELHLLNVMKKLNRETFVDVMLEAGLNLYPLRMLLEMLLLDSSSIRERSTTVKSWEILCNIGQTILIGLEGNCLNGTANIKYKEGFTQKVANAIAGAIPKGRREELLELGLNSSQKSSAEFILDRIYNFCKMHFDNNLRKGLPPNICHTWFVVSAILGLVNPNVAREVSSLALTHGDQEWDLQSRQSAKAIIGRVLEENSADHSVSTLTANNHFKRHLLHQVFRTWVSITRFSNA